MPEFYELGMGEPYPISSLHGTGTGDLLDDLVASFRRSTEEEDDIRSRLPWWANPMWANPACSTGWWGKSARLSARSPAPRATRPIRVMIYDGMPVTLIDTAGIRRRGKVEPGVEKYSVVRTMRALERCEVALLMIDATSGITAQDTHIAGYILENWKSTVVLVNKWDAVEKDTYTMQQYTENNPPGAEFYAVRADPVYLGQDRAAGRSGAAAGPAGAGRTPGAPDHRADQPDSGQKRRISMPPRHDTGRALHIYYGTQVRSDPPTFLLFVNDPKLGAFHLHALS